MLRSLVGSEMCIRDRTSIESKASDKDLPSYVFEGPGEILSIKEEYAQVRWRRPVPDVWLKLDQFNNDRKKILFEGDSVSGLAPLREDIVNLFSEITASIDFVEDEEFNFKTNEFKLYRESDYFSRRLHSPFTFL